VEEEACETADQTKLCLKYPYSESKYEAERALFDMANRPGNQIQAVVLRMATLWGLSPRMRTDLAINAMVLSAFQARKIVVHCDGMQWRPMCHVQDAAAAYVKLLTAPAVHGHVFNVVSENWTLLDLAHRISWVVGLLLGEAIQVVVTYGSERKRSYRVSGSKLRAQAGWHPLFDLRRGTTQMIDALKEHGIPDRLRGTNIAWMEHLLELEPFFRRNAEVL